MKIMLSSLKQNRKLVYGIKLIMCFFVLFILIKNALIDGFKPYINEKDYFVEIPAEINSKSKVRMSDGIMQYFYAKGNRLDKFSFIYNGDAAENSSFQLSIQNPDSSVIYKNDFKFKDYKADTYSEIELNIDGLKRNEEYVLELNTKDTNIYLYDISQTESKDGIFDNYYIGPEECEGYVSVGFKFTYQYMTLGNIAFLVLKLVLIVLLGLMLCYGIVNAEGIIEVYKNDNRKEGFLYALYFAVCNSFIFNPLDKLRTEVTTFSREIGPGYITGYDASKTISNFSLWFVVFGLTFSGYFLTINWLIKQKKTEESKKVIVFLDDLIVLADVNIVLRCITYFYDEYQLESIFYYASYLLALIIAFGFLYLVLNLDRKITSDIYYQIFLLGFLIAIPIAIINTTEWENNKLLIGIQALVGLIIFVIEYYIPKVARKNEEYNVSKIAVITCSLIPFVTSFYFEFVNIANQYKVFISHHRRNYILLCACLFFFFITILLFTNMKKIKINWWEKWTNIWIIIGVGCLSQNIPLENTYTPDIFESANSSVLISDLLNYGKIPIVEHLGHHMMNGVLGGLIYAAITGDFSGAIVNPYAGYVLVPLMLLFYFLIRKIWNERVALWTTLLFPFYGYWNYFGWGMLLVLAVIAYIEKNTSVRAVLIWLAFVWCCFSRADIGLSFGIACFISLIVYIFVEKKGKCIKQLAVPFVLTMVCCGFSWCSLCFLKGINPITRLIEFIKLFAATINWTYNTIGNAENTIFAWCYVILPFTIIIGLLYAIFAKKIKAEMGNGTWIALLMLGFAYFANYSRALARHSLNEMSTVTVVWTGYLFLALFFTCFFRKRKLFLPVYAFFILCNTLFLTEVNYAESPIADNAFIKMGGFSDEWTLTRFAEEERTYEVDDKVVTYWEKIEAEKDVKQRVQYDYSFKQKIEPFGYILNCLLDDNDTFLDFIYNSFVYSEYDRFDPVYVVQSPTMLSGELSQEYFINEIVSNLENIPIAFMPNDTGEYSLMDGIKLNYKYYKVAEFIYSNYRPLCNCGYFSVWCLNDRYDEMLEKLQVRDFINEIDVNQVEASNCIIDKAKDKIVIKSTGEDPYIYGLEKSMDLSAFNGLTVSVDIEYETDCAGEMQLFYTTEKGEPFNNERASSAFINKNGEAHFGIVVSEYTNLRLDIPEQSNVSISSIKVTAFSPGVSKLNDFSNTNDYVCNNCKVINNDDGTLTLVAEGPEPRIENIQDVLGLSEFAGKTVHINVEYSSDITGIMKVYYTTTEVTSFEDDNSLSETISGEGKVSFSVPVVEGTRIRLDIPKGSNVIIKDIALSLQDEWSLINYGYDRNQHTYSLNRLPLYWAELDEKKSINNPVVQNTELIGDIYCFDAKNILNSQDGNYIAIKTTYDGADLAEENKDDEYVLANLLVGTYCDGEFVEKSRYSFNIKEGEHTYLIRVSSDYFWLKGDVNAFKLECTDELRESEMKILQGD